MQAQHNGLEMQCIDTSDRWYSLYNPRNTKQHYSPVHYDKVAYLS